MVQQCEPTSGYCHRSADSRHPVKVCIACACSLVCIDRVGPGSFIGKVQKIRWRVIKRWCKQILAGLEYLHSQHIIHRDLKCDNIFYNGSTGDLRIGDLGLSHRGESGDKIAQSVLGMPFSAPAPPCPRAMTLTENTRSSAQEHLNSWPPNCTTKVTTKKLTYTLLGCVLSR